MTRPYIILGGGGHGRVAMDALLAAKMQVLGVCDPGLDAGSNAIFGVPVLGGDDYVLGLDPDTVFLVNGVGSVKSMAARSKIYRKFRDLGFEFGTVIHPSAIVSANSTLDSGAQIMAGAVVQCGATVGGNAIINTCASIDHDCIIAETVHIAPGATLSGGVVVGDLCHVGSGATVIQGVEVGEGALIGAGVVARKSVAAGERLV